MKEDFVFSYAVSFPLTKKKYNFEEGIDRKESKELPALSDSLYRSSKYYGLYGVDYGVGFLAARSQAFRLVKGEKTRNN